MQIRHFSTLALLLLASGCSLFSSTPSCDSGETRDLIEDLYNKDLEKNFAFKKSACVGKSDDEYFIARIGDSENCDTLKKPYLDYINRQTKRRSDRIKEYENNGWGDARGDDIDKFIEKGINKSQDEMNSIVFIDDFETSFESFLVKNEKKSEDGNSRACSIRYDLKTVSDKLGAEFTERQNILLNIYKKDDNGDREYRYIWQ